MSRQVSATHRGPEGGAAGEVFGTGRYAATRLALELLESRVRQGDRVLDLGTGSGILAAATARLCGREVPALDVDPDAVAAAHETNALNGLEHVVEARAGSIEAAEPPSDLTVANIHSNVIALAERLAASVRPGGHLIVSGVAGAMASRVIDSLCATGLALEARRSEEGWTALVFRRASTPDPSQEA